MINEATDATFKDAADWFAQLVKYIEVDPEVAKTPLKEKVALMKMMRDKLKAEVKNPSGWSKFQVVFVSIIPAANIYQYFAQNGNVEVIQWLLQSPFPLPSESDAKNEHKYKTIMSKMLAHANNGVSVLQRKLQLFDEKAAKENPLVANQNVLYKIDKHF